MLRFVPDDLVTELLVTYARQHRRARQDRRSQAERPLPWHEQASAILRLLRAAQTQAEHDEAVRQGWTLLDPPDAPLCLGPCVCGAILWHHGPAAHGDQVVCGRCRRDLPVAGRRALLLRLAEDVQVDYATASRAVPMLLGEELSTSTLRTWVQRGELVPRAWLCRGVALETRPAGRSAPLLRLGDVLDRCAGPIRVNTVRSD